MRASIKLLYELRPENLTIFNLLNGRPLDIERHLFISLLILLSRSKFTSFLYIEMKSFILLVGFVIIIPFLTASPNEGECKL